MALDIEANQPKPESSATSLKRIELTHFRLIQMRKGTGISTRPFFFSLMLGVTLV